MKHVYQKDKTQVFRLNETIGERMCDMGNKTMIYLLVFIVLFFLITDVITLMFRGSNFTVEYYNSDVLVGYTDVATITT